jgi:hypothetical protein
MLVQNVKPAREAIVSIIMFYKISSECLVEDLKNIRRDVCNALSNIKKWKLVIYRLNHGQVRLDGYQMTDNKLTWQYEAKKLYTDLFLHVSPLSLEWHRSNEARWNQPIFENYIVERREVKNISMCYMRRASILWPWARSIDNLWEDTYTLCIFHPYMPSIIADSSQICLNKTLNMNISPFNIASKEGITYLKPVNLEVGEQSPSHLWERHNYRRFMLCGTKNTKDECYQRCCPL